MKCPQCGAWTLVKSTRESDNFGHIRRRECANYHRFTTQELILPQEQIEAARIENFKIGQKKAYEVNLKRWGKAA